MLIETVDGAVTTRDHPRHRTCHGIMQHTRDSNINARSSEGRGASSTTVNDSTVSVQHHRSHCGSYTPSHSHQNDNSADTWPSRVEEPSYASHSDTVGLVAHTRPSSVHPIDYDDNMEYDDDEHLHSRVHSSDRHHPHRDNHSRVTRSERTARLRRDGRPVSVGDPDSCRAPRYRCSAFLSDSLANDEADANDGTAKLPAVVEQYRRGSARYNMSSSSHYSSWQQQQQQQHSDSHTQKATLRKADDTSSSLHSSSMGQERRAPRQRQLRHPRWATAGRASVFDSSSSSSSDLPSCSTSSHTSSTSPLSRVSLLMRTKSESRRIRRTNKGAVLLPQMSAPAPSCTPTSHSRTKTAVEEAMTMDRENARHESRNEAASSIADEGIEATHCMHAPRLADRARERNVHEEDAIVGDEAESRRTTYVHPSCSCVPAHGEVRPSYENAQDLRHGHEKAANDGNANQHARRDRDAEDTRILADNAAVHACVALPVPNDAQITTTASSSAAETAVPFIAASDYSDRQRLLYHITFLSTQLQRAQLQLQQQQRSLTILHALYTCHSHSAASTCTTTSSDPLLPLRVECDEAAAAVAAGVLSRRDDTQTVHIPSHLGKTHTTDAMSDMVSDSDRMEVNQSSRNNKDCVHIDAYTHSKSMLENKPSSTGSLNRHAELHGSKDKNTNSNCAGKTNCISRNTSTMNEVRSVAEGTSSVCPVAIPVGSPVPLCPDALTAALLAARTEQQFTHALHASLAIFDPILAEAQLHRLDNALSQLGVMREVEVQQLRAAEAALTRCQASETRVRAAAARWRRRALPAEDEVRQRRAAMREQREELSRLRQEERVLGQRMREMNRLVHDDAESVVAVGATRRTRRCSNRVEGNGAKSAMAYDDEHEEEEEEEEEVGGANSAQPADEGGDRLLLLSASPPSRRAHAHAAQSRSRSWAASISCSSLSDASLLSVVQSTTHGQTETAQRAVRHESNSNTNISSRNACMGKDDRNDNHTALHELCVEESAARQAVLQGLFWEPMLIALDAGLTWLSDAAALRTCIGADSTAATPVEEDGKDRATGAAERPTTTQAMSRQEDVKMSTVATDLINGESWLGGVQVDAALLVATTNTDNNNSDRNTNNLYNSSNADVDNHVENEGNAKTHRGHDSHDNLTIHREGAEGTFSATPTSVSFATAQLTTGEGDLLLLRHQQRELREVRGRVDVLQERLRMREAENDRLRGLYEAEQRRGEVLAKEHATQLEQAYACVLKDRAVVLQMVRAEVQQQMRWAFADGRAYERERMGSMLRITEDEKQPGQDVTVVQEKRKRIENAVDKENELSRGDARLRAV